MSKGLKISSAHNTQAKFPKYEKHVYPVRLAVGPGVKLSAIAHEKGWRFNNGGLIIDCGAQHTWSEAYRYCSERGARLMKVEEALITAEELRSARGVPNRYSFLWSHTLNFAILTALKDHSIASVRTSEPSAAGLEKLETLFQNESKFKCIKTDELSTYFGSGWDKQGVYFIPDLFRKEEGYRTDILCFSHMSAERKKLIPQVTRALNTKYELILFELVSQLPSCAYAIVAPLLCCEYNWLNCVRLVASGTVKGEVHGIVTKERGNLTGRLSVCSLADDAGTISIAGGGELSLIDEGGM